MTGSADRARPERAPVLAIRFFAAFAEMMAVLCVGLYLVDLTIEILLGKDTRWGGEQLKGGLAVLVVISAFRSDVRRLLYLSGPYLLLMYSGLMAAIGAGILIKAEWRLVYLAIAVGSAVVFIAAIQWCERIPDHPERLFGARRPIRGTRKAGNRWS